MATVDGDNPRNNRSALPGALLRLVGGIIRRVVVALGVLAALAIPGFVGFEYIVEAIDAGYSAAGRRPPRHRPARDRTAARPGLLRRALGDCLGGSETGRLHFARPSTGSSSMTWPRSRRTSRTPFSRPRTRTSSPTRESTRARSCGLWRSGPSGESRSGASTLTMQIAKHLRGGTGRRRPRSRKWATSSWRCGSSASSPGSSCCSSTSTCRISVVGNTGSKRRAVRTSASR